MILLPEAICEACHGYDLKWHDIPGSVNISSVIQVVLRLLTEQFVDCSVGITGGGNNEFHLSDGITWQDIHIRDSQRSD